MKFFSILINFFSDKRCALCGKQLEATQCALCDECLDQDEFVRAKYYGAENALEHRLSSLVSVASVQALLPYYGGSNAQKLIHELKYHSNIGVGHDMARLMAKYVKDLKIDYIVPVPLHKKKEKQRGYNQSQVIADELGKILAIEVNTNNLYRKLNNESQTTKSHEQRLQTKDIFDIHDNELFRNKTILLVDDVITTGATIADCCRALNQTEGIIIHVFSVAASSHHASR